MSRFLLIQLRPEADASDGEYHAILNKAGLSAAQVHRLCLDREDLPHGLDPRDYAGVIVGGGPGCVSDSPADKSPVEARIEAACLSLMPTITDHDVPFMGCCYGIGILAHHLGAPVNKQAYGEAVGPTGCTMTPEGHGDPILEGLPDRFEVFVGHKEAVQARPKDTAHLLEGDACPFQMIRHGRNVYATQFHPEADARVFAQRIEIYKGHGYFPPHAAQALIDACEAADVRWPERILENFVRVYG